MKNLQDLREQRDAEARKLQALVSIDRAWNPETDQPVYDAGIAAIDNFDKQIARIRQVNELAATTALNNAMLDASERQLRNAGDKASDALRLFNTWLRKGDNAIRDEEWPLLRNTMSTGTPSEGGYTVATEVADRVVDKLKQFGGMRSVATVMRTEMGNPMNYPTSDGTSEIGEQVDENASASDLDLGFGVTPLPVYKFSSKVVTVPIELLMDSAVDIEGFVVNRLGQRLGRITNQRFTTGTGASQPNGVVTAASAGKVGLTGQTAITTYDDLVDLQHAVDPAYRALNNCGFMMHDTSVKMIRKIKDNNQRPIFVPGYETGTPGGAPDTLLGSPVTINQDMAPMAANAKSILFGDFSYYVIRDVLDVMIQRYTDSAYAKKGQVGFLAWLRSGGNLVDAGGAIRYYQNSAT